MEVMRRRSKEEHVNCTCVRLDEKGCMIKM